jgi:hypothetical protein
MSYQAVDALVATEVMGYTLADEPKSVSPVQRWDRPNMDRLPTGDWSPTRDLNDSFTALAKAAKGGDYSIYHFGPAPDSTYCVEIDADNRPQTDSNLRMAICRCALVAAGVSEAEIKKAVKEGG